MFKKMTLSAAACVALISTSAHADFAPSEIDHSYVSEIGAADPYYRLPFTIPGLALPASFWCPAIGFNFPDGSPKSRDGSLTANKIVSADGQSCVIQMPKDMASGEYEVNLVFTASGTTYSQTYRFFYTDAPFDDGQHADVNAALTTHFDRKIRAPGEVIHFAFNVLNLTRQIPAGDYIRIDIGASDVLRAGEAQSVDFGFACPALGSGVPVGGGFTCSGSYTVKQADIEAGEIMLAFGAALSTSQFALYGGTLMENFEVEKASEPETPVEPEKTACKPMPVPAGGAKFVFRYPTGSACS